MTTTSIGTTHNDEPVIDDILDRTRFKDMLKHQIENAKAPKVIAVHGTWGSGKTSLLQQLYTDYGGNRFDATAKGNKEIRVKPIWFEAWHFQNEPNILAALLKEIRDQLAWYHKTAKYLKAEFVAVFNSLLQSIDATIEKVAGAKGFAKALDDNHAAYQKSQLATPLDSHILRQMLQEAINQLLSLEHYANTIANGAKFKATNERAVIFIDDLDRCEPDTAFKILEAIKLHLNLNNCVFVLGMDVQAVERIIGKYYEKMMLSSPGDDNAVKLKDLSRLYLEKICQDAYHVPVLNHDTRIEYLMSLLGNGRLKNVSTIEFEIVNQLRREIEAFEILPPHPRSIKAFANIIISFFHKEEAVRHMRKHPDGAKHFLIFAYLYAFHFELYQLCFLYPSKDFYNAALFKYCSTPEEFVADDKKAHPLLRTLILPESGVQDAMSGATSEKRAKDFESRLYPHDSLRQVFWVRDLITSTGNITTPIQAIFKV